MKTAGLKKAVELLGVNLRRNSPTILTGMSVAGLATTVILAVKATPKAMRLLDEYDEYLGYKTMSDPLTAIKVAYKPYVPAVIMGGVTIACIIGANSINLRRNAALASVYSITEATLKEYQAKVIETIGEKKERAIKDEIAQDKLTKDPINNKSVIMTGKGDTLCYDVLSGRYFKSDIESLRKLENEANHTLIHEVWMSLNEFYYKMGLEGVKLGDETGWNSDRLIEFDFSSKITTDGQLCLVIDYINGPSPTFRN